MDRVKAVAVTPKYRKENGLAVIDIAQSEEVLGFTPFESLIVQLPAGEVGGNHSHARYEAFIALTDGAELHWVDNNGDTHIEDMTPEGEITAFIVPPHIPHAIANTSLTNTVTLVEYGSQGQGPEDVTRENVVPV